MKYQIHQTPSKAIPTMAYVLQNDIDGAVLGITSGDVTVSIQIKEIYNYVKSQEELKKNQENTSNEEASRKSSLDS